MMGSCQYGSPSAGRKTNTRKPMHRIPLFDPGLDQYAKISSITSSFNPTKSGILGDNTGPERTMQYEFKRFSCSAPTPKRARKIAYGIKRHIILTRELNRTPSFVKRVHKRIVYLHNYNCRVAEISSMYPMDHDLKQLLLKYIELEMGVLKIHKMSRFFVEDRMLKLLSVIFSKYCYYLKGKFTLNETWQHILDLFEGVSLDVHDLFSDIRQKVKDRRKRDNGPPPPEPPRGDEVAFDRLHTPPLRKDIKAEMDLESDPLFKCCSDFNVELPEVEKTVSTGPVDRPGQEELALEATAAITSENEPTDTGQRMDVDEIKKEDRYMFYAPLAQRLRALPTSGAVGADQPDTKNVPPPTPEVIDLCDDTAPAEPLGTRCLVTRTKLRRNTLIVVDSSDDDEDTGVIECAVPRAVRQCDKIVDSVVSLVDKGSCRNTNVISRISGNGTEHVDETEIQSRIRELMTLTGASQVSIEMVNNKLVITPRNNLNMTDVNKTIETRDSVMESTLPIPSLTDKTASKPPSDDNNLSIQSNHPKELDNKEIESAVEETSQESSVSPEIQPTPQVETSFLTKERHSKTIVEYKSTQHSCPILPSSDIEPDHQQELDKKKIENDVKETSQECLVSPEIQPTPQVEISSLTKEQYSKRIIEYKSTQHSCPILPSSDIEPDHQQELDKKKIENDVKETSQESLVSPEIQLTPQVETSSLTKEQHSKTSIEYKSTQRSCPILPSSDIQPDHQQELDKKKIENDVKETSQESLVSPEIQLTPQVETSSLTREQHSKTSISYKSTQHSCPILPSSDIQPDHQQELDKKKIENDVKETSQESLVSPEIQPTPQVETSSLTKEQHSKTSIEYKSTQHSCPILPSSDIQPDHQQELDKKKIENDVKETSQESLVSPEIQLTPQVETSSLTREQHGKTSIEYKSTQHSCPILPSSDIQPDHQQELDKKKIENDVKETSQESLVSPEIQLTPQVETSSLTREQHSKTSIEYKSTQHSCPILPSSDIQPDHQQELDKKKIENDVKETSQESLVSPEIQPTPQVETSSLTKERHSKTSEDTQHSYPILPSSDIQPDHQEELDNKKIENAVKETSQDSSISPELQLTPQVETSSLTDERHSKTIVVYKSTQPSYPILPSSDDAFKSQYEIEFEQESQTSVSRIEKDKLSNKPSPQEENNSSKDDEVMAFQEPSINISQDIPQTVEENFKILSKVPGLSKNNIPLTKDSTKNVIDNTQVPKEQPQADEVRNESDEVNLDSDHNRTEDSIKDTISQIIKEIVDNLCVEKDLQKNGNNVICNTTITDIEESTNKPEKTEKIIGIDKNQSLDNISQDNNILKNSNNYDICTRNIKSQVRKAPVNVNTNLRKVEINTSELACPIKENVKTLPEITGMPEKNKGVSEDASISKEKAQTTFELEKIRQESEINLAKTTNEQKTKPTEENIESSNSKRVEPLQLPDSHTESNKGKLKKRKKVELNTNEIVRHKEENVETLPGDTIKDTISQIIKEMVDNLCREKDLQKDANNVICNTTINNIANIEPNPETKPEKRIGSDTNQSVDNISQDIKIPKNSNNSGICTRNITSQVRKAPVNIDTQFREVGLNTSELACPIEENVKTLPEITGMSEENKGVSEETNILKEKSQPDLDVKRTSEVNMIINKENTEQTEETAESIKNAKKRKTCQLVESHTDSIIEISKKNVDVEIRKNKQLDKSVQRSKASATQRNDVDKSIQLDTVKVGGQKLEEIATLSLNSNKIVKDVVILLTRIDNRILKNTELPTKSNTETHNQTQSDNLSSTELIFDNQIYLSDCSKSAGSKNINKEKGSSKHLLKESASFCGSANDTDIERPATEKQNIDTKEVGALLDKSTDNNKEEQKNQNMDLNLKQKEGNVNIPLHNKIVDTNNSASDDSLKLQPQNNLTTISDPADQMNTTDFLSGMFEVSHNPMKECEIQNFTENISSSPVKENASFCGSANDTDIGRVERPASEKENIDNKQVGALLDKSADNTTDEQKNLKQKEGNVNIPLHNEIVDTNNSASDDSLKLQPQNNLTIISDPADQMNTTDFLSGMFEVSHNPMKECEIQNFTENISSSPVKENASFCGSANDADIGRVERPASEKENIDNKQVGALLDKSADNITEEQKNLNMDLNLKQKEGNVNIPLHNEIVDTNNSASDGSLKLQPKNNLTTISDTADQMNTTDFLSGMFEGFGDVRSDESSSFLTEIKSSSSDDTFEEQAKTVTEDTVLFYMDECVINQTVEISTCGETCLDNSTGLQEESIDIFTEQATKFADKHGRETQIESTIAEDLSHEHVMTKNDKLFENVGLGSAFSKDQLRHPSKTTGHPINEDSNFYVKVIDSSKESENKNHLVKDNLHYESDFLQKNDKITVDQYSMQKTVIVYGKTQKNVKENSQEYTMKNTLDSVASKDSDLETKKPNNTEGAQVSYYVDSEPQSMSSFDGRDIVAEILKDLVQSVSDKIDKENEQPLQEKESLSAERILTGIVNNDPSQNWASQDFSCYSMSGESLTAIQECILKADEAKPRSDPRKELQNIRSIPVDQDAYVLDLTNAKTVPNVTKASGDIGIPTKTNTLNLTTNNNVGEKKTETSHYHRNVGLCADQNKESAEHAQHKNDDDGKRGNYAKQEPSDIPFTFGNGKKMETSNVVLYDTQGGQSPTHGLNILAVVALNQEKNKVDSEGWDSEKDSEKDSEGCLVIDDSETTDDFYTLDDSSRKAKTCTPNILRRANKSRVSNTQFSLEKTTRTKTKAERKQIYDSEDDRPLSDRVKSSSPSPKKLKSRYGTTDILVRGSNKSDKVKAHNKDDGPAVKRHFRKSTESYAENAEYPFFFSEPIAQEVKDSPYQLRLRAPVLHNNDTNVQIFPLGQNTALEAAVIHEPVQKPLISTQQQPANIVFAEPAETSQMHNVAPGITMYAVGPNTTIKQTIMPPELSVIPITFPDGQRIASIQNLESKYRQHLETAQPQFNDQTFNLLSNRGFTITSTVVNADEPVMPLEPKKSRKRSNKPIEEVKMTNEVKTRHPRKCLVPIRNLSSIIQDDVLSKSVVDKNDIVLPYVNRLRSSTDCNHEASSLDHRDPKDCKVIQSNEPNNKPAPATPVVGKRRGRKPKQGKTAEQDTAHNAKETKIEENRAQKALVESVITSDSQKVLDVVESNCETVPIPNPQENNPGPTIDLSQIAKESITTPNLHPKERLKRFYRAQTQNASNAQETKDVYPKQPFFSKCKNEALKTTADKLKNRVEELGKEKNNLKYLSEVSKTSPDTTENIDKTKHNEAESLPENSLLDDIPLAKLKEISQSKKDKKQASCSQNKNLYVKLPLNIESFVRTSIINSDIQQTQETNVRELLKNLQQQTSTVEKIVKKSKRVTKNDFVLSKDDSQAEPKKTTEEMHKEAPLESIQKADIQLATSTKTTKNKGLVQKKQKEGAVDTKTLGEDSFSSTDSEFASISQAVKHTIIQNFEEQGFDEQSDISNAKKDISSDSDSEIENKKKGIDQSRRIIREKKKHQKEVKSKKELRGRVSSRRDEKDKNKEDKNRTRRKNEKTNKHEKGSTESKETERREQKNKRGKEDKSSKDEKHEESKRRKSNDRSHTKTSKEHNAGKKSLDDFFKIIDSNENNDEKICDQESSGNSNCDSESDTNRKRSGRFKADQEKHHGQKTRKASSDKTNSKSNNKHSGGEKVTQRNYSSDRESRSSTKTKSSDEYKHKDQRKYGKDASASADKVSKVEDQSKNKRDTRKSTKMSDSLNQDCIFTNPIILSSSSTNNTFKPSKHDSDMKAEKDITSRHTRKSVLRQAELKESETSKITLNSSIVTIKKTISEDISERKLQVQLEQVNFKSMAKNVNGRKRKMTEHNDSPRIEKRAKRDRSKSENNPVTHMDEIVPKENPDLPESLKFFHEKENTFCDKINLRENVQQDKDSLVVEPSQNCSVVADTSDTKLSVENTKNKNKEKENNVSKNGKDKVFGDVEQTENLKAVEKTLENKDRNRNRSFECDHNQTVRELSSKKERKKYFLSEQGTPKQSLEPTNEDKYIKDSKLNEERNKNESTVSVIHNQTVQNLHNRKYDKTKDTGSITKNINENVNKGETKIDLKGNEKDEATFLENIKKSIKEENKNKNQSSSSENDRNQQVQESSSKKEKKDPSLSRQALPKHSLKAAKEELKDIRLNEKQNKNESTVPVIHNKTDDTDPIHNKTEDTDSKSKKLVEKTKKEEKHIDLKVNKEDKANVLENIEPPKKLLKVENKNKNKSSSSGNDRYQRVQESASKKEKKDHSLSQQASPKQSLKPTNEVNDLKDSRYDKTKDTDLKTKKENEKANIEEKQNDLKGNEKAGAKVLKNIELPKKLIKVENDQNSSSENGRNQGVQESPSTKEKKDHSLSQQASPKQSLKPTNVVKDLEDSKVNEEQIKNEDTVSVIHNQTVQDVLCRKYDKTEDTDSKTKKVNEKAKKEEKYINLKVNKKDEAKISENTELTKKPLEVENKTKNQSSSSGNDRNQRDQEPPSKKEKKDHSLSQQALPKQSLKPTNVVKDLKDSKVNEEQNKNKDTVSVIHNQTVQDVVCRKYDKTEDTDSKIKKVNEKANKEEKYINLKVNKKDEAKISENTELTKKPIEVENKTKNQSSSSGNDRNQRDQEPPSKKEKKDHSLSEQALPKQSLKPTNVVKDLKDSKVNEEQNKNEDTVSVIYNQTVPDVLCRKYDKTEDTDSKTEKVNEKAKKEEKQINLKVNKKDEGKVLENTERHTKLMKVENKNKNQSSSSENDLYHRVQESSSKKEKNDHALSEQALPKQSLKLTNEAKNLKDNKLNEKASNEENFIDLKSNEKNEASILDDIKLTNVSEEQNKNKSRLSVTKNQTVEKLLGKKEEEAKVSKDVELIPKDKDTGSASSAVVQGVSVPSKETSSKESNRPTIPKKESSLSSSDRIVEETKIYESFETGKELMKDAPKQKTINKNYIKENTAVASASSAVVQDVSVLSRETDIKEYNKSTIPKKESPLSSSDTIVEKTKIYESLGTGQELIKDGPKQKTINKNNIKEKTAAASASSAMVQDVSVLSKETNIKESNRTTIPKEESHLSSPDSIVKETKISESLGTAKELIKDAPKQKTINKNNIKEKKGAGSASSAVVQDVSVLFKETDNQESNRSTIPMKQTRLSSPDTSVEETKIYESLDTGKELMKDAPKQKTINKNNIKEKTAAASASSAMVQDVSVLSKETNIKESNRTTIPKEESHLSSPDSIVKETKISESLGTSKELIKDAPKQKTITKNNIKEKKGAGSASSAVVQDVSVLSKETDNQESNRSTILKEQTRLSLPDTNVKETKIYESLDTGKELMKDAPKQKTINKNNIKEKTAAASASSAMVQDVSVLSKETNIKESNRTTIPKEESHLSSPDSIVKETKISESLGTAKELIKDAPKQKTINKNNIKEKKGAGSASSAVVQDVSVLSKKTDNQESNRSTILKEQTRLSLPDTNVKETKIYESLDTGKELMKDAPKQKTINKNNIKEKTAAASASSAMVQDVSVLSKETNIKESNRTTIPKEESHLSSPDSIVKETKISESLGTAKELIKDAPKQKTINKNIKENKGAGSASSAVVQDVSVLSKETDNQESNRSTILKEQTRLSLPDTNVKETKIYESLDTGKELMKDAPKQKTTNKNNIKEKKGAGSTSSAVGQNVAVFSKELYIKESNWFAIPKKESPLGTEKELIKDAPKQKTINKNNVNEKVGASSASSAVVQDVSVLCKELDIKESNRSTIPKEESPLSASDTILKETKVYQSLGTGKESLKEAPKQKTIYEQCVSFVKPMIKANVPEDSNLATKEPEKTVILTSTILLQDVSTKPVDIPKSKLKLGKKMCDEKKQHDLSTSNTNLQLSEVQESLRTTETPACNISASLDSPSKLKPKCESAVPCVKLNNEKETGLNDIAENAKNTTKPLCRNETNSYSVLSTTEQKTKLNFGIDSLITIKALSGKEEGSAGKPKELVVANDQNNDHSLSALFKQNDHSLSVLFKQSTTCKRKAHDLNDPKLSNVPPKKLKHNEDLVTEAISEQNFQLLGTSSKNFEDASFYELSVVTEISDDPDSSVGNKTPNSNQKKEGYKTPQQKISDVFAEFLNVPDKCTNNTEQHNLEKNELNNLVENNTTNLNLFVEEDSSRNLNQSNSKTTDLKCSSEKEQELYNYMQNCYRNPSPPAPTSTNSMTEYRNRSPPNCLSSFGNQISGNIINDFVENNTITPTCAHSVLLQGPGVEPAQYFESHQYSQEGRAYQNDQSNFEHSLPSNFYNQKTDSTPTENMVVSSVPTSLGRSRSMQALYRSPSLETNTNLSFENQINNDINNYNARTSPGIVDFVKTDTINTNTSVGVGTNSLQYSQTHTGLLQGSDVEYFGNNLQNNVLSTVDHQYNLPNFEDSLPSSFYNQQTICTPCGNMAVSFVPTNLTGSSNMQTIQENDFSQDSGGSDVLPEVVEFLPEYDDTSESVLVNYPTETFEASPAASSMSQQSENTPEEKIVSTSCHTDHTYTHPTDAFVGDVNNGMDKDLQLFCTSAVGLYPSGYGWDETPKVIVETQPVSYMEFTEYLQNATGRNDIVTNIKENNALMDLLDNLTETGISTTNQPPPMNGPVIQKPAVDDSRQSTEFSKTTEPTQKANNKALNKNLTKTNISTTNPPPKEESVIQEPAKEEDSTQKKQFPKTTQPTQKANNKTSNQNPTIIPGRSYGRTRVVAPSKQQKVEIPCQNTTSNILAPLDRVTRSASKHATPPTQHQYSSGTASVASDKPKGSVFSVARPNTRLAQQETSSTSPQAHAVFPNSAEQYSQPSQSTSRTARIKPSFHLVFPNSVEQSSQLPQSSSRTARMRTSLPQQEKSSSSPQAHAVLPNSVKQSSRPSQSFMQTARIRTSLPQQEKSSSAPQAHAVFPNSAKQSSRPSQSSIQTARMRSSLPQQEKSSTSPQANAAEQTSQLPQGASRTTPVSAVKQKQTPGNKKQAKDKPVRFIRVKASDLTHPQIVPGAPPSVASVQTNGLKTMKTMQKGSSANGKATASKKSPDQILQFGDSLVVAESRAKSKQIQEVLRLSNLLKRPNEETVPANEPKKSCNALFDNLKKSPINPLFDSRKPSANMAASPSDPRQSAAHMEAGLSDSLFPEGPRKTKDDKSPKETISNDAPEVSHAWRDNLNVDTDWLRLPTQLPNPGNSSK